MKSIETKIIGFNKIVGFNISQRMIACFQNIECSFDDIEYIISYHSLCMTVILKTNNDEISLKTEFWTLYEYIGFVLGYYPRIDSSIVTDIERYELNLTNIVEKYKTHNNFILDKTQFIHNIDIESFKTTYSNFKILKRKAEFQISMYNVSMMYTNQYPEIKITNILQALDGIYDKLSLTKEFKMIVNNKKGIQELKKKIKNIDLIEIFGDIKNIQILEKQIDDTISRLGYVNFDTKLRKIFDIVDVKCNLFELEKKQTDDNKSYEKFIVKCKHTRNMLSHAVNIEDSFTGVESAIYIYKLTLVFRILVLLEIGLYNNINISYLNEYIFLINERLVEELKLNKLDSSNN